MESKSLIMSLQLQKLISWKNSGVCVCVEGGQSGKMQDLKYCEITHIHKFPICWYIMNLTINLPLTEILYHLKAHSYCLLKDSNREHSPLLN